MEAYKIRGKMYLCSLRNQNILDRCKEKCQYQSKFDLISHILREKIRDKYGTGVLLFSEKLRDDEISLNQSLDIQFYM